MAERICYLLSMHVVLSGLLEHADLGECDSISVRRS